MHHRYTVMLCYSGVFTLPYATWGAAIIMLINIGCGVASITDVRENKLQLKLRPQKPVP
jgi:hypothetical protein